MPMTREVFLSLPIGNEFSLHGGGEIMRGGVVHISRVEAVDNNDKPQFMGLILT